MDNDFRSETRALVVEAFTWTPALEMAGEVALTGINGHERNAFCHLAIPNPDEPPRFAFLETLGIWRRELKIKRLVAILGAHGVEIAAPPALSESALRDVQAFVANAPSTFQALREYRYGSARLGAGAAASLAFTTRHSLPDVAAFRPLTNEYLRIAALAFEMTKVLIAGRRPPCIFTYNGRFAACLGIAEAARSFDVPLVIYETGATRERYELFRESPHNLAFISSEIRRYWSNAGPTEHAIAHEFFARKRARDDRDWKVFVDDQEPGALPARPPGRRHIVFFTSSDYEMEYVGRESNGLFIDQQTAIEHLVRWASARSDVTLTIREHPHSREVQPENRAWLMRISAENVFVVHGESPVDSYALMDSADVVVSAGSTMGIEAAYAGRASIVVEPAYYSDLGCVYEPRTIGDLEALLEDPALLPLPVEASLPVGYYLANYGIPYRYYEPTSLYTGKFLGTELVYSPAWAERLRITPFARAVWRRFRPRWIARQRVYAAGERAS